VIREGENAGRLLINIATSPIASKNIIADVRDIQSIVSLGTDDIGEEDVHGNVIAVAKHYDVSAEAEVAEPTVFTLPGHSFRNKQFMDWVLSNKDSEESTTDDFHDLMY
jgi:hypothetical protein